MTAQKLDGSGPAAAPGGNVKSADRALAILDLVASRGSIRFNELVASLDLPRSSTHGLLQTLVNRGWLDLDAETRRYSIGLHAWNVGQAYPGHGSLLNVAVPVMDALARRIGQTVQLARLDGVEALYVAISEAPQPIRLANSVGMRLHAHATGIGKALLAQLPPEESAHRLRSVALPRFTPQTIVEPDRLDQELATIRARGYALDQEEVMTGCHCVAVPLLDDGNGFITALSITSPTSRDQSSWPEDELAALQDAAAQIRSRLDQLPVRSGFTSDGLAGAAG
jgi:DNA-binding IclR family transcriptional regulator